MLALFLVLALVLTVRQKAIAINFGFARYHGGKCYLRFDDTNPEAEEEAYFKSIEEMVHWLGFEPYKITVRYDLRNLEFLGNANRDAVLERQLRQAV